MVSPIPDHAFFEKPVLHHLLGQRLLQVTSFGSKRLHFGTGGLTGRITGQTLLAGFKELLRPAVVQARGRAPNWDKSFDLGCD